MHYFKWVGSKESARQLWENREALDKYLARLKELMEGDEPTSEEKGIALEDSDNAELQSKKLSNEDTSSQI